MRSLTVLLILLSAPGLALAQAGRFLLAVGDVAVARGQAEIRAATGTPVQSGDTIRVGPASNAQIRMTDESIVGLRPGTVFRIDAYEYSGQAEPRSIFSLLKGGFRTVTGAIGRLHSRERYAVRTPTATIGIRGTHYTVVHCDNDCGADRGSIANGTYGGVTDGRIEVVNQTGEHEFAANTFFYVASAGTAPQNLIAPPNFLYDRLEGQARSRGSQGNESSETLARAGLNAESRPSEVPPPPQPSSFIVTEQRTSSGQPAVLAAAPALGFAGAWTSATGGANSVTAFVSSEMLTRTGSGTSQTLTAFNIPGTASGAATALGPINESGGFDPGDGSVNANWGVWTSGSITDGIGTTIIPGGAHYIFGNLTPPEVIAARTGTLLMFAFAGTTPTSNIGSFSSGTSPSQTYPTLSLNFDTRSVQVGGFSWSFGASAFNFSQGGAGTIFAVPGRGAGINANLVGTFSGSLPATAAMSGAFFGPAGDHLGVGIGVTSASTGSAPVSGQGVAIYKPGGA
ncbi:MAG: FecR domain-containing protein [Betaproteobacteria bacterium]|nr:MAG: FecR domain-containing protein [Betaproteobacteria bacterium]